MNTIGDYVTKWGTFGNGPGQFNQMTGIDVDLNGDIWVSDSSNNRIQKFASILDVNKISAPDWFSQVEKWVTEHLISQEEFNHAREYLVEKGIIQLD